MYIYIYMPSATPTADVLFCTQQRVGQIVDSMFETYKNRTDFSKEVRADMCVCVCVCVCVYIYIYIYIYIYAHMIRCLKHTRTGRISLKRCVLIYIYMYIYMYVCMYIYTYIYICTYDYKYMHVLIYECSASV